MIRRYLLFSLICATIFTGCASVEHAFVVRRDVPRNPTIAVIPANNLLYQHAFANRIEGYVLESGLSLVDRPGIVETVVAQEAEKIQPSKLFPQLDAQSAQLTQTYSGFGETTADYVIQSYAVSQQVRILKLESGEVLASFELFIPREDESEEDDVGNPLYEPLRKIGLPVIIQEVSE